VRENDFCRVPRGLLRSAFETAKKMLEKVLKPGAGRGKSVKKSESRRGYEPEEPFEQKTVHGPGESRSRRFGRN